VLEVGAGFGLFLDKIAGKRVPREGVTALEYSEKALDVLRGKGYTAIPEDVRSATLEPGFDAIFLFQVVEHMDGLAALFARLSHLLAPGGRVFIAVPNSKKTDFQEASGSMLDMPPNHIGRWCPSALESIVAGTGLHIEAVETQPFFIRDFIKEDIAYSYGRKCQRSGTLMNWSRSVRTKKGGKLVGMAFALAAAPLRIPVWLRAAAVSRDIGGSLWIELTKGIGPQPV
jgi:SAM-dependent methyltransferase